MAILQRTIEQAMRERAPALHAALKAEGQLGAYLQELDDQIADQVTEAVMSQRLRGKWDRLGPLECAARMNTAKSLATEVALAQALEFPQDETSPPSPDETSSSPTPT